MFSLHIVLKWMQSTISHLRSILILCDINFYICQVILFVGVSTKSLYSDQCDYCLKLCNPISVTGAWNFLFWSEWVVLETSILISMANALNCVFWSVWLVLETLCPDQCNWCLKLCVLISVTGAWNSVFWSEWLVLEAILLSAYGQFPQERTKSAVHDCPYILTTMSWPITQYLIQFFKRNYKLIACVEK